MKCPKCQEQNKPGVKNCEYCNEVMPVRKKKATTVKKTTVSKKKENAENNIENKPKTKVVKKTVKKESVTKKVVKQDEIKKEPIIELSEEKKALKKFVKKVRKINKLIYLYIGLAILALILIFVISNNSNTITCKVNNDTNNASYKISVKIKYKENKMKHFTYVTKFVSEKKAKKEYESTYKTILEGLETKTNYDKIVEADYGKKFWAITYRFDENNLKYSSEYIGMDLLPYVDDVNVFVDEIETVGFECK